MTADLPDRAADREREVCVGCQPCAGCGHHVPRARIPALCKECAARRPEAPAWVHPDEQRITLAAALAARPAPDDGEQA